MTISRPTGTNDAGPAADPGKLGLREPGQYSRAGIPVYPRVEADPPVVVAYRLGPDGLYAESGRAEPGVVLELTEPFAVTIDPAALLR